MSTHSLDVSGARPITLTANDPARTAMTLGAKAGDDVTATLSGFRELRVSLTDGRRARIERRRYTKKTARYENGKTVKGADGETVYDTEDYEELILVMPGSTFFGRASIRDEEKGAEGVPTYEPTPHTMVQAKRQPDLHFLESGTLLEEFTLAELLTRT